MPRLVKFSNGKYGVEYRYLFFFKRYRDLESNGFTWAKGSCHFQDCQGTLEECEKFCVKVTERL